MLHPRTLLFAIFFICVGLMLGGMYFQYVMDLAPCPLCITQRVFICTVGFVALLAALQCPGRTGVRIYALLGLMSSVIGGGVSARHTWLQSLPEELAPACGPGLSYMFETLPFRDALEVLFRGDGNCADISWSFLGLSIPGWTLFWFIILAGINIWVFYRPTTP